MIITLFLLLYTQFANLLGIYLSNIYDYPSIDPNNIFVKPLLIQAIITALGLFVIYIISRINYVDFKISKPKEGIKIVPYTALLSVVIVFSIASYLTPTLSVFRYDLHNNISTLEWVGMLVLNALAKPISSSIMYFAIPITVLSTVLDRKKYQRTTAEITVSTMIYAISFISITFAYPYIHYNIYTFIFGLVTGALYANIFKNTSSIWYVVKANLIVNIVPILTTLIIQIT